MKSCIQIVSLLCCVFAFSCSRKFITMEVEKPRIPQDKCESYRYLTQVAETHAFDQRSLEGALWRLGLHNKFASVISFPDKITIHFGLLDDELRAVRHVMELQYRGSFDRCEYRQK